MPGHLAATFWELLRSPFQHAELVWGIVPLYFGWMVTELTSAKATFNTAVQTGFALLWAGAHWLWQVSATGAHHGKHLGAAGLFSINTVVTLTVLVIGVVTLWSGLRRRYPRGMSFLGHTRFAGYFMIALFPIQSGLFSWTWDRVVAIAVFAVPVWLLLHFALMPLRKK